MRGGRGDLPLSQLAASLINNELGGLDDSACLSAVKKNIVGLCGGQVSSRSLPYLAKSLTEPSKKEFALIRIYQST